VAHSLAYWTPTPAARVRSQEVVVASLVGAVACKFGRPREEYNEECCGVCCVLCCVVCVYKCENVVKTRQPWKSAKARRHGSPNARSEPRMFFLTLNILLI